MCFPLILLESLRKLTYSTDTTITSASSAIKVVNGLNSSTIRWKERFIFMPNKKKKKVLVTF